MTLATSVHIQAPLDYQLVFLKCREIIGIPAEHPFEVRERKGLGWDNGEWVRSIPGGFCSALDVSHNDGQLLVRTCDKWCEQPCDYHVQLPPAFIDVRLDTTYGYRGPNGEGCSELHRRITAELGAWLDEQGANWWAQDERTGEWHERTPCPVERVSA